MKTMTTRTLNPYIKLVGKMDHRKHAWEASRPGTQETPREEIICMDFSLNSMAVYHFEARTSGFFRDLIMSIRPIAPWALGVRSMPEVNRDNIAVSGEYDNDMGYDGIDTFFARLEKGATRDNAREALPLTVASCYSFVIDYRALISFCQSIESLNERLFREYCIPLMFAADIDESEYKRTKLKSSLDYHIITPNEMIDGVVKTGNMVHGHYRMKMSMASQFLRQHHNKVKLGLWNMIPDYYHNDIRQSDIIDVVFYSDIHSYNKLMSMRSHWMLDWNMDMWGTLLGDYIKDMTVEDFWFFIPSGNNQPDPYFADNYNRVQRTDPGLPCPIMTECFYLIDERRKELGDNPVLDMYEGLFQQGLVKDNPENKYRLEYEAAGEK